MSVGYDARLVNPAEGELLLALEEAGWGTALSRQAAAEQVAASAQGRAECRSGPVAAVAWWTDHQGRKHVRVTGGGLRGPGAWPALWHVHPERVYRVARPGRDPAWLVCCDCGEVGAPEALGWAGDCCGPCHDRREAGEPSPPRRAVRFAVEGKVESLAVESLAGRIAAGTKESKLLLLEPAQGRVEEFSGLGMTGSASAIQSVAFSPCGGWLAAGNLDPQWVQVRNLGSGEMAPLPRPGEGALVGLCFSPAGPPLLAACDEGGGLHVWRRQAGEWRSVHRAPAESIDDPRGAVSLAFAPDGSSLAVGERGGRVRVLSTARWGERVRIPAAAGCEEAGWVAFLPGGRRLLVLAAVRDRFDSRCRLWDLALGREERRAAWEGLPVATALAADGRTVARLAVGTAGATLAVTFWDVDGWREAGRILWDPEDGLRSLAFGPDGDTLAVGSSAAVRLVPWRALLGR